MIPWGLYNLTPRDASGVLLRVFSRRFTINGTFATVTQGVPVPNEQYLLVHSIGYKLSSSLSTAIGLDVWESDAAGGNTQAFLSDFIGFVNGGGNTAGGNTLSGSPLLIVGPSRVLQLQARFSSAAAQQVDIGVHGLLIPKGTMAFN